MRYANPLKLVLIALCAVLSPLTAMAELIQRADVNGIFGISQSGNLFRKYWSNGQWNTQVIGTWGGKPLAGSLITGELVGTSANVYGVNEHGQIFTTWTNNGVITYAIIGGNLSLTPSLTLSHGNGVFGITQSGGLMRTYFGNSGWQIQNIPTWGSRPVVGSLIAGDWVGANANIYGVNENGEIFTTWVNNGAITYAIIGGTQGIIYNSLVLTDNGVFGVTQRVGGLRRTYWSNGSWHVQNIPTWGGKLVGGSLIAGDWVGANANVFGVNEYGQLVTTWMNNGVITYAIIGSGGPQGFAPNSLVLTDNGVFGVTQTGGLRRAYWSNGSWQFQNIPTWGGKIIPESLIAGDWVGANANVFGVNEYGQLVTTWVNNGVITYAIIP